MQPELFKLAEDTGKPTAKMGGLADELYDIYCQREITDEDIAEVPGLAELRERIEKIEAQAKVATGKNKYLLKKQVIEMRQEQYILKEMWRQPHRCTVASHTSGNRIEISDEVYFDKNGDPTSDAVVTFFKPEHISAILCNYEILETGLKHKYNSDFHYMMRDFKKYNVEITKEKFICENQEICCPTQFIYKIPHT